MKEMLGVNCKFFLGNLKKFTKKSCLYGIIVFKLLLSYVLVNVFSY